MGLFRHLKELALKIMRSEDGVWDRPKHGKKGAPGRVQHEDAGDGAEEGGAPSLDETDEAAAAWTAMNRPDE